MLAPDIVQLLTKELEIKIEDRYLAQTAEFLVPELYIQSLDTQLADLFSSEVYDEMIYLRDGLASYYEASQEVVRRTEKRSSIEQHLNTVYLPDGNDPNGYEESAGYRDDLYWRDVIEPAFDAGTGPLPN
ncbi:MAG: hypothetical protein IPP17_30345 [Bacteroidetes bacterium]|nr:hypothetical protein [Bacteroidota bacterium]